MRGAATADVAAAGDVLVAVSFNRSVTIIPEPEAVSLLAVGLSILAFRRRK